MKDWLFDLLLDPQTISRGYFERKELENLLTQSVASGAHSKELFSLATLELWHRTFLTKDSSLTFAAETPGGREPAAVTVN